MKMKTLFALFALGLAVVLTGCKNGQAPPAANAPAAAFSKTELVLFKEKCELCHKWSKTIVKFEGTSLEKRASVIKKMQAKKRGWISESEAETITKLLYTDNLSALKAAVDTLDAPRKK